MSLVSIITPCYNSAKFISATIESVINQSYIHWEMIIVDDFSKDKSVEIISKYTKNNSRIKLISLKQNVGSAEARNIALRAAKGRFIAFLDSDDIWYPNKLEVQIKFMIEHDYPFTFSSYDLISEDGSPKSKIIQVPVSINYHQYLQNTIIGCLTVVIDKEKIGYFEMPNIKSSHDMALWLSLLKRGINAYGIKDVLASYRLVLTSNTAKKHKAAKDVWSVYRDIEKINLLKSAYYFICYSFNAIKKRF